MSEWEKSPARPCFCGSPCSTYKSKSDEYFKCGVKVDYKDVYAKLNEAKTKEEKECVLASLSLGCKLNLKKADYEFLRDGLFDYPPTCHPKCEHQLYAKIAVSHSEKNNNKTFFTCSAQFPDPACNYFRWVDDDLINEIHDSYLCSLEDSREADDSEAQDVVQEASTKPLRKRPHFSAPQNTKNKKSRRC